VRPVSITLTRSCHRAGSRFYPYMISGAEKRKVERVMGQRIWYERGSEVALCGEVLDDLVDIPENVKTITVHVRAATNKRRATEYKVCQDRFNDFYQNAVVDTEEGEALFCTYYSVDHFLRAYDPEHKGVFVEVSY